MAPGLHGSARYLQPDVVADFSGVMVTEEGPDQVRVAGGNGRHAVDQGVDGHDARQRGVDQLERRDLASLERSDDRAGRRVRQAGRTEVYRRAPGLVS